VIHGDDKVYIFKSPFYQIPKIGPENDHMEKVLEMWTNFAKTGDPNNKIAGSKIADLNWLPYEEYRNGTFRYFEIGNDWSNKLLSEESHKPWHWCQSDRSCLEP
jgi:carboxylesterase type B